MTSSNEILWKRIKFILLCVLCACLVYILLIKYTVNQSLFSDPELLEDINNSERILEIQQEYAQKSAIIQANIDSLDFNVKQEQRTDKIIGDIKALETVYKLNNNNSRFYFGIISSKTLKLYFDSKDKLNSDKNSLELLKKNLDDCRSNL